MQLTKRNDIALCQQQFSNRSGSSMCKWHERTQLLLSIALPHTMSQEASTSLISQHLSKDQSLSCRCQWHGRTLPDFSHTMSLEAPTLTVQASARILTDHSENLSPRASQQPLPTLRRGSGGRDLASHCGSPHIEAKPAHFRHGY